MGHSKRPTNDPRYQRLLREIAALRAENKRLRENQLPSLDEVELLPDTPERRRVREAIRKIVLGEQ